MQLPVPILSFRNVGSLPRFHLLFLLVLPLTPSHVDESLQESSFTVRHELSGLLKCAIPSVRHLSSLNVGAKDITPPELKSSLDRRHVSEAVNLHGATEQQIAALLRKQHNC